MEKPQRVQPFKTAQGLSSERSAKMQTAFAKPPSGVASAALAVAITALLGAVAIAASLAVVATLEIWFR